MRIKSLFTGAGVCSVILLSSFFLSNCTPKVTEEQLAKLKELREKERSLTQQISVKQGEIGKLEKELNSRKSEADNCGKEREFVKQKLAQWPNIWPDYTPSAPETEVK